MTPIEHLMRSFMLGRELTSKSTAISLQGIATKLHIRRRLSFDDRDHRDY